MNNLQTELACLPEALLPWFRTAARPLPWRRDTEPYHVWLSEVMLQQTRAAAVESYYERFLSALPTVSALAEAPEEQLYKLWEGLGYYSRVRNLQKAARVLVEKYGGVFPRDPAAVLALPGVGAYTAGAVCSICFGLPTPAVDGNVLRVTARVCGIDDPTDLPKTRLEISDALACVYPAGQCGAFTQALMELGALVCVPNGQPLCEKCPAAAFCRSRADGRAMQRPVRLAKKPRRVEEKTVLILACGGRLAVCKRPKSGLLAGLWEFPNVPGHLSAQEALDWASARGLEPDGGFRMVERTHIFTHVQWNMRGFYLTCRRENRFVWADRAEIAEKIALPTAFRLFFEEESQQ